MDYGSGWIFTSGHGVIVVEGDGLGSIHPNLLGSASFNYRRIISTKKRSTSYKKVLCKPYPVVLNK